MSKFWCFICAFNEESGYDYINNKSRWSISEHGMHSYFGIEGWWLYLGPSETRFGCKPFLVIIQKFDLESWSWKHHLGLIWKHGYQVHKLTLKHQYKLEKALSTWKHLHSLDNIVINFETLLLTWKRYFVNYENRMFPIID